MRKRFRFSPLHLAFLLVPLSACDRPALAPPAGSATPAPVVAELRCTADARSQTVSCAGAGLAGGARGVIVGGQHHYVRLTSSGTTYDAGADVLSSNVTVQNLLLSPLGTSNGSTSDGAGVRVFFASGPTNGVTLVNMDGADVFTASNQPFFRYLSELDGGILRPGHTSAAKTWRFGMNGASSFTFTVYVQAATPPGGAEFVHLDEVTAGNVHNCARSAAGAVYCWGSDFSGQRGDGLANGAPRVPTPVPMPGGAAVAQVASGLNYSCALTTSGPVYCWGNAPGYVRLGSPGGNQLVPTALDLPAGVAFTSIATGGSHACGLDGDGRAYCWGTDNTGEMGNGPTDTFEHDTARAVIMPANVRFLSMSAGAQVTCAIGNDHNAYCWGYGDWGQLGVGQRIYSVDTPVKVVLPPLETGFASISVGQYHTCAIALSGRAYCWGRDWEGQLGDGPAPIDPTQVQYAPSLVAAPGVTFTSISASGLSTCATAANGTAWCWGDDTYGVLGNGADDADHATPALVSSAPGISFTGIATGGLHTCASSTGATYCWGLSYWGALGDGAETNRDQPVAVAGTW